MAKPSGPLLSLGASGSLAKTLVFSKWKGRPYIRQHVVPGNPQSTAQTLTRDIFANLNQIWKNAGSLLISPWDRFAVGQVLTGRNAFIGQNVKAMRSEVDLAKMIFSPGAKGGLGPVSVVSTPGVGTLSLAITEPAIPTGWAITRAAAAMIVDGTPEGITDFATIEGEDLTTPFVILLTGVAVTTYSVGAWLEWTKPDGSVAYGPSITQLDTTL